MEGVVHDLLVQSPGEVVSANDILLAVIPVDRPLVAKVKVQSKDIGHIRRGQSATLRVTTYDPRRYGVLKGEVEGLSPTAFVPEDKTEPFYEATIKLQRSYLGTPEKKMVLLSGMTLTADIKTGTKTLLEYLLKPIYLAKESAFHER
ncbi:MAG: hypothetical protein B0D96_13315 [Candidatus Sedimenticola endophacoides]|uniref:AprE-like beta-barrel domain-containing protein n=1 Tax=Candidatus Sedimenticola endophacoides TaxID=2548426 RepID=A0A657Q7C9_9GAMM|nr:MAG: hypothetical protein B0D94_00530 [Candidatus Sedimenticola endophacoides]OQX32649.1 MAG: hypothetical protein B0D96_13315 [Candidatus Sedimenticola endophacoides]OQX33726.1 MAG: hypothetical protein B0D84_04240 [Candidatus Sedimenticola endophacoides]OQX44134.1 MAG: hypothetical protein B0D88_03120 [Candidatus Sedimenticola endophacoides]OQX44890.1 MAG: hypothetical protein B0D85_06345 [Candidatus Sedimenticola endophacoides]